MGTINALYWSENNVLKSMQACIDLMMKVPPPRAGLHELWVVGGVDHPPPRPPNRGDAKRMFWVYVAYFARNSRAFHFFGQKPHILHVVFSVCLVSQSFPQHICRFPNILIAYFWYFIFHTISGYFGAFPSFLAIFFHQLGSFWDRPLLYVYWQE